VDWVISISYGDDIDVAKKALMKFALEDERIEKDPEPYIGVALLNSSSVDLTLRVWTHVDNYNEVFFDMNERVYREFKQLGLNFPFPQMSVHLKNQNNA
jgi:small conductance mechanosensitive channel